ncbi:MAG: peptide chain release factor N(5)-glutamine methyltransferase [Desulfovibrio sp.]|jgi:release factor glutamine methyltransferase|nr:peptide chain release factor N(5)-glutamine methyltransferase [Desulfovibrio sp.]
MLLRRYMTEAARHLERAGVDSPQLCAQLLVCSVLNITRLDCVLGADRKLTEEQLTDLNQLILRRTNREPLVHILGRKEFFSRNFHITPDTLIPRPETELLVETALNLLPESKRLFFADIGAGSGCIGITLALERGLWRGVLLEISEKALGVAKFNAQNLNATSNLAYIRADMCRAPLKPCFFDLLVSNPPYIAESETDMVMDEVLCFEPHCALFSLCNGTLHLEAVVRLAARVLKKEGMVLVEHGAKQGEQVRALLDSAGVFGNIGTQRDLAGLDRCTCAIKT